MSDDPDENKIKKTLLAEIQSFRAELLQSSRTDMFQAILDNIPLRPAMEDPGGHYVFVTKALAAAIGMREDGFIGKMAVDGYGQKRGA
jgi:PAS domain-containing protein